MQGHDWQPQELCFGGGQLCLRLAARRRGCPAVTQAPLHLWRSVEASCAGSWNSREGTPVESATVAKMSAEEVAKHRVNLPRSGDRTLKREKRMTAGLQDAKLDAPSAGGWLLTQRAGDPSPGCLSCAIQLCGAPKLVVDPTNAFTGLHILCSNLAVGSAVLMARCDWLLHPQSVGWACTPLARVFCIPLDT